MSRAVLADRFVQCVGETPMKYLAKWRMQLATGLLATPGLPVEAVGEKVGYQSEAAFNRAFKNIVGMPPGAWRRARVN
ncbi:HTH-type transcriptional regulator YesS [compost metagenome]